MKVPTISINNYVNVTLASSITSTVGYAISAISHLNIAAMIGSWSALGAATFLGSSLLFIPGVLLLSLIEENLDVNNYLHTALTLSFVCGSSALGASLLGIAIIPSMICSLIGIAAVALISFCSGDQHKPDEAMHTSFKIG